MDVKPHDLLAVTMLVINAAAAAAAAAGAGAVFLQLASNSSEFVSSLTFAARKRRKNMSLTLSQVGRGGSSAGPCVDARLYPQCLTESSTLAELRQWPVPSKWSS